MTPRLVCLDLRGAFPRPVEAPCAPTVLCLGNFDGVHLAHAALLQRGRALVEIRNQRSPQDAPPALCGVFCFFRPSGDYFLPEDAHPTHLTTLKERILAFRRLGVDLVWLCDFQELRELEPMDFLALLRDHCHCEGAVCGYNYRFGRRAAGTPELLTHFFDESLVSVLPSLEFDGLPVSSTRIRTCLAEGAVEIAAQLLGRPYALEGRVLHGKSLGHTWGFPTANQNFPADRLIPAFGVYAVICHTPDGVYPGVANVGLRPTVEATSPRKRANCETHIMGFSGDLYGKTIRVEFRRFLRPEQKFASADELKQAIQRDKEAALAVIQGHRV